MTKAEIQDKIQNLGDDIKWISPNEPITKQGIIRLLKALDQEITELEEHTLETTGLGITMWSPNVAYSQKDMVLYFKEETKQLSPDVGKRNFVFLLMSEKDNNSSIPNYELIDGIPNFSKTNWKLINPTSYLLQDLIEMKKVVKDVFQSLLDEHVEEKHNLMNGQSISQNLLKKDYSNLVTPWEFGKYAIQNSSVQYSNGNSLNIVQNMDSTGIMECFVEWGYDIKANPLDEDIRIQDNRYYYQGSPIWDESDKNIFASKYIDSDKFSVTLKEHDDRKIQFTNLRYGTNIFHKKIEFNTQFVDDQYCVFFDTYGNGEFVFGYDKQDIESKEEPTYDAIVSMPMLMNKSKMGFDIVLPIHTYFNSLKKYNIGVPWNNKFRLQAIGRFR